MCGIAGIVALNAGAAGPDRDALAQMAGAIHHRGPDEFGMYRDDRAGLAHARLSIVDLTSGQQPQANEDHTLWITYNGEIFNFVELRAELQALGHSFRTRSDTEVVLHAYEAWGNGAFSRFNGQFAVGLWDSREEKLVLARDRMGVRPLYVCEHRGRVLFASEVRAIFAGDPSVPRAFDPIGLEQTFTFWSVVPPQAVFAGVEELRPGYVRTYAAGTVSDVPFHHHAYPCHGAGEFDGSLEDAVDAVRAALREATRLRVQRADVPVGSYLSGGLDSSLVAALGQEFVGERLSTFSLRFEDAEYDETAYQRVMARALGSDHHEIVVSRADIAGVFPDVVAHAERPILRTAPAPLYLLSKSVADAGIKVVLTGEGADEVFGGYDLFREAKVRRFWAKAPESTLRPRLLERLYPYLARSPVSQQAMARQFFGRNLDQALAPGFSHDPRWHTTGSLKRLFSAEQQAAVKGRDVRAELLADLPAEFSSWSPLAQDQYLETRTLLAGYLLSSQGDRMLMANSVEGRFPFLDVDVVALANSLPPRFKLLGLDEKHVVKKAARGLVDDAILARTKQPYRAPDAVSFLGADAPAWVGEMMSPAAIAESAVFEPSAVLRLWQKVRQRQDDGQFSNADNMAIVGVLSTQLLHHSLIRSSIRPARVEFSTVIDHTASTPHPIEV